MTRDEFLARFNNRFGYYPQGPRTDAYFASLWAFDLLSSEIAEKDARIAELREAMEHFCKNYLLDERDDESLCYDDKHYKAIQRMFAALKETT